LRNDCSRSQLFYEGNFVRIAHLKLGLLLSLLCVCANANADDQLRLRDICRLKGQEENKLQGIGLVVGLNGTGDDSIKPTTRALAQMMRNMGANIAQNAQ